MGLKAVHLGHRTLCINPNAVCGEVALAVASHAAAIFWLAKFALELVGIGTFPSA